MTGQREEREELLVAILPDGKLAAFSAAMEEAQRAWPRQTDEEREGSARIVVAALVDCLKVLDRETACELLSAYVEGQVAWSRAQASTPRIVSGAEALRLLKGGG